jgi:hypothetical protein
MFTKILNQINSQIQLHLAEFMANALCFLSSLIKANSVEKVKDLARKKGLDPETFKLQVSRGYTCKLNYDKI